MPVLNGPPVVPEEFKTGGAFVMLCTFQLAEGAGKVERLTELLTNNTKHARGEDEKGTISYRFYFSVDKKTCVVYEEYADMDGYEAHNRSPTGPVFGKALMTENLFSSIAVDFLRETIVQ